MNKTIGIAFFFLLVPLLYAKQAPSVGHLAMCSGVKQCLSYDLPQCTVEEKKPNPNIKYNAEFCAPYVELRGRGLRPSNHRTHDLYRYMGRQYRIVYQINGTIPVSKETMIYLFDNMEFTAQLVNAYRKTKYSIRYDTRDKKNFSGDNGGNMQGRFMWLLSDSAGTNPGMHHVFFGWGRTKIATANFSGTATAILDLKEVSKNSVAYEFRAIVSPSGPAMNVALNLFSGVIKGMIKSIIEDIEKSASEFAKGNRKPIEAYAPFKDRKWQTNLREFDEVAKK
ncbi:MAG: hypothetical protein LBU89_09685 [Fibromonadaceae bacterium]|jgi:hypothetical protein|nr:hypothetical protein [Fibromonadaceae bacterium]